MAPSIRPWVAAAVLSAPVLGACTPPAKIVTHVSTARDQMKLLYSQGDAQGVVKCQVAADGALSQCRNMTITIDE